MEVLEKTELCCSIIHDEEVSKRKVDMLEAQTISDLAIFFKILGDPTRIKIIHALLPGELCVCDIAAVLGMSNSAISHQLKELKQTRLVRYRKEGKVVYYSLDDRHVNEIIEFGLKHVQENRG